MNSEIPSFALFFSKRHFVAILVFFGMMIMFSLRANLSIAIVEMTSSKVMAAENRTVFIDPEFNWDSLMKGMVLSVFSYGFAFGVIGGYLAIKFGGTTMFGIGILVTSVITLLTPYIVRSSFAVFIMGRILQGAFESFAFTSVPEIWSRWSTISERGKLMSYGHTGVYVGTAVTFPLCGFIISQWGWSAAFYVTGALGIVWSLLWFLFISADPSTDKWISQEEVSYLRQEATNFTMPKKNSELWYNIIKSKPVLALCFAKFAYGTGFTLVVTCLPLFIQDMIKADLDIRKIGILSALPNVVSIFTLPLFGWLLDYIQNKRILTTTQEHKLFMCAGYSIGAILLFLVAYTTSFTICMMCLVVFKVLLSLNYLIILLGNIYLAPKCSSMVSGIAGLWYSLSSVAGPTIIGFIVNNNTKEEWSTCFISFGLILLASAIVYLMYGSSEAQPWSYLSPKENHKRAPNRQKKYVV